MRRLVLLLGLLLAKCAHSFRSRGLGLVLAPLSGVGGSFLCETWEWRRENRTLTTSGSDGEGHANGIMLPSGTKVQFHSANGGLSPYVGNVWPRHPDRSYNGVRWPGTLEPNVAACFAVVGFPREGFVVLSDFEYALRVFLWALPVIFIPSVILACLAMLAALCIGHALAAKLSPTCCLLTCASPTWVPSVCRKRCRAAAHRLHIAAVNRELRDDTEWDAALQRISTGLGRTRGELRSFVPTGDQRDHEDVRGSK